MKNKKMIIPPFILCLMIIFVVIFIYSMLAPVLYPIDLGETNLTQRLLNPSIFGYSDSGHLLGTDYLGRDFAIRLVYATRTSLLIAFSGMIIAIVAGITLGVLSGFVGGWVDDVVIFLISVRHSIPAIIIGIVAVTIFGSSQIVLVALIGIIGWSRFARQTRAQILQIKEENFIECSRSIGSSKIRILFEHVLVNIASPLIVTATLNISSFILLESTLSYLGLGIQPPQTSLGVMVSAGRNYLLDRWWLTIIPSIVIVIIVMTVSLIGDWLRDRLDPKLHNKS